MPVLNERVGSAQAIVASWFLPPFFKLAACYSVPSCSTGRSLSRGCQLQRCSLQQALNAGGQGCGVVTWSSHALQARKPSWNQLRRSEMVIRPAAVGLATKMAVTAEFSTLSRSSMKCNS